MCKEPTFDRYTPSPVLQAQRYINEKCMVTQARTPEILIAASPKFKSLQSPRNFAMEEIRMIETSIAQQQPEEAY